VEEVQVEGIDILVLHGEFDAFSTPMLGERLDAAIERGLYELVIDMCDVQFADVSTLNRIVRAMKDVYRHNGHLVLGCAQRQVRRAIELAGLRHAVRVYDSREEAIAALLEGDADGPDAA
jgi:anti-anti-sigma factor